MSPAMSSEHSRQGPSGVRGQPRLLGNQLQNNFDFLRLGTWYGEVIYTAKTSPESGGGGEEAKEGEVRAPVLAPAVSCPCFLCLYFVSEK